KERGFSLAAALGVGGNMGGSHRYADLLFSYLAGSWEPYGTVRAVHVKVDATDFKDKDTGRVVFKVPEDEFSYGEGMLGVRYWITPRWSLNAEAGKIFPISSNLEIDGGVFAGAALGYRF
ncbi:MAG TPA: hypothetical protein PL182_06610, partial [Pseudobdellovibrionaceae bacterium]|nr:hypothetical protein [Pseudobdellovibrionaceae bacterium]